MAACDWWEMSSEDVPAVVAMASGDLSDFGMIPDRLTQGILNALLLMRILKVMITVGRFTREISNLKHTIIIINSCYYCVA